MNQDASFNSMNQHTGSTESSSNSNFNHSQTATSVKQYSSTAIPKPAISATTSTIPKPAISTTTTWLSKAT